MSTDRLRTSPRPHRVVTQISTTITMPEAVVRGRARFLHFTPDVDKTRPAPGSVIYTDFAGPLLASYPHRFTVYIAMLMRGRGMVVFFLLIP